MLDRPDWLLARTFGLSRGTAGALIMLGGLGNTSFIGIPIVEICYGCSCLSVGIPIDQLGTHLVLSMLDIQVACIYSKTTLCLRRLPGAS